MIPASPERPDLARQREAVVARHVDVEQGEVDRPRRHHLAQRVAAVGLADRKAVAAQIFGDRLADVLVVVDDDDMRGFAHASPPADDGGEHGADAGVGERLFEDRPAAAAQELVHAVAHRVAGDEGHALDQLRADLAQPLVQLGAVEQRHPEVGEEQVEIALVERIKACGAVAGDRHLEAFALDQLAQRIGDVGLVLDDQRAPRAGATSGDDLGGDRHRTRPARRRRPAARSGNGRRAGSARP